MSERMKSALAELSELLRSEREALRVMDVAKVESLSESKLACLNAIETASMAERGTVEKSAVTNVIALARDNQRLLVHARTCIRGALEALAGVSTGEGNPAPVRLNVRG
jgi:hypothetical protein